MVVGGGELADTHTNYCGPMLIESLQSQYKLKTHLHKCRFIFFNWSHVCSESVCAWEESWTHLYFGLLSNMPINKTKKVRNVSEFNTFISYWHKASWSSLLPFNNKVQIKYFVLFLMFLPRGSTPGFAGTGLNCGGPLGPGVLDSWDMGVPGFIPGVLDFSL